MRTRVQKVGAMAIGVILVAALAQADVPLGIAFMYQGQLMEGGVLTDNVDGAAAYSGDENLGETGHDPNDTQPFTTPNPELETDKDIYDTSATRYWLLKGNAGTNPATDFIGTTDNQPLIFKVDSEEVASLEWEAGRSASSPNTWHGSVLNRLQSQLPPSVQSIGGRSVGGGGEFQAPNLATDDFTTIGGGKGNQAGNYNGIDIDATCATVAGGCHNTASGAYSAAGGGSGNAATGMAAVVAGGASNTSSGDLSAICGGEMNTASGNWATVVGGLNNQATGDLSMIPGGESNVAQGQYSFAGGLSAQALHNGSFVWADSTGTGCVSTGANQFLIHAGGGVGIGTTTPANALHVKKSGIARVIVESPDDQAGIGFWSDGVGDVAVYSPDGTDDLRFWVGSWDRMHVGANGRVGIGTNTPKELLHVNGDYYGRGHFFLHAYEGDGANGTAYLQARDDSGTSSIGMCLRTQDAGAIIDALYATPAGNVGIGGGAVNEKLHVVGTGNLNGGYFEANQGTGIFGVSTAASGQHCGVIGSTTSTGGYGVWGMSDYVSVRARHGAATGYYPNCGLAASAIGTYCPITALAEDGTGVYSTTNDGDGVDGRSTGTNKSGVVGQNGNPNGWGVYAVGRMGSSGTKSFQIDHPLDPANRYLQHYTTEGPEPLNSYSGTAVLDDAGEARVLLPDYFEAVNRDFRYQLTAIGAAMPNLHIAAEIEKNEFLIAGGEPGMKVSWEVKGVRNDPYVRAYGAPVEVEKPEEERGRYLHPELYGQPAESNLRPALQPETADLPAVLAAQAADGCVQN